MKALGEYFVMVVFTLLLNRVHGFAMFSVFYRETVAKAQKGIREGHANGSCLWFIFEHSKSVPRTNK